MASPKDKEMENKRKKIRKLRLFKKVQHLDNESQKERIDEIKETIQDRVSELKVICYYIHQVSSAMEKNGRHTSRNNILKFKNSGDK